MPSYVPPGDDGLRDDRNSLYLSTGEQSIAGDCTTLEALANQAFAESGAIDILVNCAALPESIAFLDLKRATFEKILQVNVLGPFQLAQACARRWIRDGRSGRIINVALGARGTAHPGKAALGSSAAAVEMLTKKIATELGAHNIIAYCVVLDGQDESDACELAKVAQALAFLASDNARHVNGATFATCNELIAASPIEHA